MSVGNCGFHPSIVEDKIYDLMAEEQYVVASDAYTDQLFAAVNEMFTEEFPHIEWQAFCSEWPNMTGGVATFAWVENGHPHLVGWDYYIK